MKLPQRVALIWSQSLNDVIGSDGGIPKEFRPDLAYFKKLTINQTVIMGRKTWESLPIKPLPNRVNVVLTSDKNYQVPEGVQVIQSLDDLEVETEALFFIGGTKIYDLGLPYATEAYITVTDVVILGGVRLNSTTANAITDKDSDWSIEDYEHIDQCPLYPTQSKFFFKKRTGASK